MKSTYFTALVAAITLIQKTVSFMDFFVDLIPVMNETTSFTLNISDDDHNTTFDIYFSIANGTDIDCIDPHISFAYERIDYDSKYEYIAISQNDGTVIEKCGGGVRNQCGVFKNCLEMYNLRDVDTIYAADSDDSFYKVSLFESHSVDSLCWNSSNPSNTINARLTMYCLATASPPTMEPTAAPTGQYCGYAIENQSCFEKDVVINPSFTEKSKFETIIQNINDNRETLFYVAYTIEDGGVDCVDPKISFLYERIDYDQDWEYIDISDNRDGDLARCQFRNNSCGEWATCLDEYDVHLSKISSDAPYVVLVTESSEVDALCYGTSNFSINAKLTLTCHAGTAEPTTNPTTAMPTPPTTQPAAFTCDETIEGYLEYPQQIDWYTVAFTNGDLFNVTFDSCNSSYDTYLYLKEKDSGDMNDSIAECDDCGNCGTRAQLYVSGLAGNSEYLLGIGGYGSSHGYYTLDVMCDYVADAVTCGDSLSGITSYAGDINWRPLVIKEDYDTVMIDSCDTYTTFDTYLYLKNKKGEVIQKCDDCGDCNGKAQMEIQNVEAGEYKVGIGGFKKGHGRFNVDIICKNDGSGSGSGGGGHSTGVVVVISVVAVIVIVLLVITFVYYKRKTDRLQAQLSGSAVAKAIGGGDRLLINESASDLDQAPKDQNVEYQRFDDDADADIN